MAFCANCGSQVSGQFCPKCGTAVGGGAMPLGSPAVGSTSGLTTNLASALCYIPLVGIIFLLIDPYKANREIRFHAFQSIFLFIAFIILRFVVAELYIISWSLSAMLGMLVGLGELILILFLAFKAYNNQRVSLPVIGPLAEKQA